jgi:predicted nuclease with RNAse H fold
VIDLNEKHQIYPTQDYGVVVISGGVAEVLSRKEAERRLDYAIESYRLAGIDHDISMSSESELARQVRKERMEAYHLALAHKR